VLGVFGFSGSKNIVSINKCAVLDEAFADVFTLFDGLINQHKALHSISHLQLCQSDEKNFVVIRHTKQLTMIQRLWLST